MREAMDKRPVEAVGALPGEMRACGMPVESTDLQQSPLTRDASHAIVRPVPSPAPFADRLKQAQAEAGFTNEQLARKADVSLRLVAHWRSGSGEPNGPNLVALAAAVGKDAAWFYADTQVAA